MTERFAYEVWLFNTDECPRSDVGGINMEEGGFSSETAALNNGLAHIRMEARFCEWTADATLQKVAKLVLFKYKQDGEDITDRQSIKVRLVRYH